MAIPSFTTPESVVKKLKFFAIAGMIVFLLGLVLRPLQIWPNFLIAIYYLLTLSLGAAFFLAIQHVTKAGWGTVFRRVPEAMVSVLPYIAIFMIVFLFAFHPLYEMAREHFGDQHSELTSSGLRVLYAWTNSETVAGDSLLQEKSIWLNVPFFVGRSIAYLLVWIFFTQLILKFSRKQDQDGELKHTYSNVKASACFLVVFGITFTLASFDWIMSIEPHWFSTIFGVYNFSGMFLNAIATITVLVILLKKMSPFKEMITTEHIHDLGKFLFAFSSFWAYIWFSQYMLIWYSNMPEETGYYSLRHSGFWGTLALINLTLNWGIPFLVLLSSRTKRSENVLLKVSIIVMIGHWLDLYLMIFPAFSIERPLFSLWEVIPFLGALALFFLAFFRALEKVNPFPTKDPTLRESLNFHQ